jgi:hypothetical protein
MKQPSKIIVPEDLAAAFPPDNISANIAVAGQPAEKVVDDKKEKSTINTNSIIRDVDYDFSKLAALPKKDLNEAAAIYPQTDMPDIQAGLNESPGNQFTANLAEEKNRPRSKY